MARPSSLRRVTALAEDKHRTTNSPKKAKIGRKAVKNERKGARVLVPEASTRGSLRGTPVAIWTRTWSAREDQVLLLGDFPVIVEADRSPATHRRREHDPHEGIAQIGPEQSRGRWMEGMMRDSTWWAFTASPVCWDLPRISCPICFAARNDQGRSAE